MRVRGKLKIDKGITLPDTGGTRDLSPEKIGYSDAEGKFIWNNFYIPTAVVGELYKKHSLVIGEDGFIYRAVVDNAPVIYTVPPNTPIDPMDPTYWSSVKEGDAINLQDVTDRGNTSTNDIIVNDGTDIIKTVVSKGIITVTDDTFSLNNTAVSKDQIAFTKNGIESIVQPQEHTEGSITVQLPAKSGILALEVDSQGILEYTENEAYVIGQHVYYDLLLWECTTDVPVAPAVLDTNDWKIIVQGIAESILGHYPSTVELLAANASQLAGGIYYVTNATGFSEIIAGDAYVEFTGIVANTLADYVIVSNDPKESVLKSYADLDALKGDQSVQIQNAIYVVLDAAGFTSLIGGYVYVEYLGAANGLETDYRIISNPNGGSSTSDAVAVYIVKEITQLAHGLTNFDNVYNNGAAWVKALADSDTTLKQGMAVVHSTDIISVISYGTVTSVAHGFTISSTYHLSDVTPGLNTLIIPIASTSFSQATMEIIDADTVKVIDQAITQGEDALEPGTTFTSLTDTPNAYAGNANKVVYVNATEDALEFRVEPVVAVSNIIAKGVKLDGLGEQVLNDTTWTTIDSWSIEYNDNNYLPGSGEVSGIITIPEDGTYTIMTTGWFASDSTVGTRAIRFLVSGSVNGYYGTYSTMGNATIDTGLVPMISSITMFFVTGTTISVQGWQNSGAPLDFGSDNIEEHYLVVTPIS